MSKRGKAELLRALAIVGLGGATVSQLVGIRDHLAGGATASPAPATPVAAAEQILSELRRIEAGGLLAATNRSIVLRVPTEIGVVCANGGGETVIAALPSARESVERASGLGWYAADGEFAVSDVAVAVEPTASSACTAAAVDPPDGTVYLTLSPAAPAAHVGAPAVLFERVEYALRPSARGSETLSLWRTASSESHEVVAAISSEAGFRFFVDASAVATATVPAPLARVRGIELLLPAPASDDAGLEAPTAVFFRNAAT